MMLPPPISKESPCQLHTNSGMTGIEADVMTGCKVSFPRFFFIVCGLLLRFKSCLLEAMLGLTCLNFTRSTVTTATSSLNEH